jgi:hypothetical protein
MTDENWLALLGTGLGTFGCWHLWDSLRTGRWTGPVEFRPATRKDQPIDFWFGIVMTGAFIVLCFLSPLNMLLNRGG